MKNTSVTGILVQVLKNVIVLQKKQLSYRGKVWVREPFAGAAHTTEGLFLN